MNSEFPENTEVIVSITLQLSKSKLDKQTNKDIDTEVIKLWRLIIWNDNVNTFDNVIITLIQVCEHEPSQAEQCAIIIHSKGKCSVKEGEFDDLKIMKEKIISRGIQATVELNI